MKINLTSTTTESVEVEIAAVEGGKVIVTWWELNQIANKPAVRISIDNGQTFGLILKLDANSTIGGKGKAVATE